MEKTQKAPTRVPGPSQACHWPMFPSPPPPFQAGTFQWFSSPEGTFLCSHWLFLILLPTPHSLDIHAGPPGSSAACVTSHSGTVRVQKAAAPSYTCSLHHCSTIHISSVSLVRGVGMISLPKEVEMVLKVTLISRNKGRTAWRALHTCFSHANHTHLHPGNGFCCVQKPREEDV